ncbi:MAG: hypothetical protein JWQ64_1693, partial [Subtercola sp.]|nr:hypothetical protein [Subtercola sp.]
MELEGWDDLFVASAGAAAALAGLIIVAMSVNIKQIIAIPSMPSRAGTSIASLVLIVVVSIGALIPVQASWGLGLQTLVFALVALGFAIDATVRNAAEGRSPEAKTQPRPVSNVISNGVLSIAQVLPFVVGGVV